MDNYYKNLSLSTNKSYPVPNPNKVKQMSMHGEGSGAGTGPKNLNKKLKSLGFFEIGGSFVVVWGFAVVGFDCTMILAKKTGHYVIK